MGGAFSAVFMGMNVVIMGNVISIPADYRECDIDTRGKPRGAKRLVFTAGRRIYYTEDHYKTFKEVK